MSMMLIELPDFERVLLRIWKEEVQGFAELTRRFEALQKIKDAQTKNYMQEVVINREKARNFDEGIADGSSTLTEDDLRMFFDAGAAVDDPVMREILEMIIREKVGVRLRAPTSRNTDSSLPMEATKYGGGKGEGCGGESPPSRTLWRGRKGRGEEISEVEESSFTTSTPPRSRTPWRSSRRNTDEARWRRPRRRLWR